MDVSLRSGTFVEVLPSPSFVSDFEENYDAILCGTCSTPCPSFKTFQTHKLNCFVSASASSLMSPSCPKSFFPSVNSKDSKASFKTPQSLESIISKKSSSYSFDCYLCQRAFKTSKALKRHWKSTHVLPLSSFTCDICDKDFKSEFYLKTHKIIHTGDLPFPCSLCSTAFNRKDKLKRHSLIHRAVKDFKCSECYKEFYRIDKYKEHLKSHSKSNSFVCSECSAVFNVSKAFKEHQINFHSKKSSLLKCFACSQTFKLEKQRQKHHQEIHGIVHVLEENNGVEERYFRNVENEDVLVFISVED